MNDDTWYSSETEQETIRESTARLFRRYDGRCIDGEVVDAPRVLAAEPAGRQQVLVCTRHGNDCDLHQPGCVQHMVAPDPPDERTWTDRLTDIRVVDRRRIRPP